MSRANNLKIIQERIEQASKRAGRNVSEVQLIAVSKVFLPADIQEMYDLGVRHFGESRAQELRDKVPVLPGDIQWHFMGPLQTNKIKYVAPNAYRIHAIDSFKLAQAIADYSKAKSLVPNVLIEINSSGEEQKHGFMLENAFEECLRINEIENVNVVGLMTMAPYTDDTGAIRKCFADVKALQTKLQTQLAAEAFNELSMGMSGDFEIAIEEGSTMVRIGTAIFGQRRR